MLNIYSDLDEGAPALSHEMGGLKTVLKACLVTGYGKHPAAGWQIHEHNNQSATFEPHVLSTGCRYRFHDEGSHVRIIATDEDDREFASGYIGKRFHNVNNNNRWLVLADEKHCYTFLQTDEGRSFYAAYYFGDVATLSEWGEAGALLANAEPHYNEYNNALYSMRLQLSDGQVGRLRDFDFGSATSAPYQNVFIPILFDNQHNAIAGQMPFLYSTPNTDSFRQHDRFKRQAAPELNGDVLTLTTAWIHERRCVILTQYESTSIG